jgi:AraC-like DNA-binding protein
VRAGYSELCLKAQTHSEIAELGAAHILDLISHATGVLTEAPSTPIKAPAILSMMLDHIDRHSGDPGLSAATLAQKFHCSVRYVHKLFATTGRSVAEHVNGRRIIACTRDLLDHGQNRTIAEIAFAAGFQDISHFNRLFKRSNGATPSEFRRVRVSSRD